MNDKCIRQAVFSFTVSKNECRTLCYFPIKVELFTTWRNFINHRSENLNDILFTPVFKKAAKNVSYKILNIKNFHCTLICNSAFCNPFLSKCLWSSSFESSQDQRYGRTFRVFHTLVNETMVPICKVKVFRDMRCYKIVAKVKCHLESGFM